MTAEPLADYMTVGQVAELLGVNPHVIRYLFTSGRIAEPRRWGSNYRIIHKRLLDKIKACLREDGNLV